MNIPQLPHIVSVDLIIDEIWSSRARQLRTQESEISGGNRSATFVVLNELRRNNDWPGTVGRVGRTGRTEDADAGARRLVEEAGVIAGRELSFLRAGVLIGP